MQQIPRNLHLKSTSNTKASLSVRIQYRMQIDQPGFSSKDWGARFIHYLLRWRHLTPHPHFAGIILCSQDACWGPNTLSKKLCQPLVSWWFNMFYRSVGFQARISISCRVLRTNKPPKPTKFSLILLFGGSILMFCHMIGSLWPLLAVNKKNDPEIRNVTHRFVGNMHHLTSHLVKS